MTRGVLRTAEDMRAYLRTFNDGSGCWTWTGTVKADWNYGVTSWQGRQVLVHRLSHELFVGPIPEGLTIDHLCENTLCVNPAHLDPCTNVENHDRWARRRKVCRNGHSLADVQPNERGFRPCPTCITAAKERKSAATRTPFIRSSAVAQRLGMTRLQVNALADRGQLEVAAVSIKGRHRLFDPSAIDALAKERAA